MKTTLPRRLLATLIGSLCLSTTTLACGPDDCGLELTLSAQSCGLSALPFLTPSNDTRLNMALLIADQGHYTVEPWQLDPKKNPTASSFFAARSGQQSIVTPIDYYWIVHEGDDTEAPAAKPADMPAIFRELGLSTAHWQPVVDEMNSYPNGHCQSNGAPAVIDFMTALANSTLPNAQRKQLAEARLSLIGHCESDMPALNNLPQQGEAKEFSQYLQAAVTFYAADYHNAQQRFQALTKAQQPWITETAHYMLFRVALNQAQVNSENDWGSIDVTKTDKNALRDAKQYGDSYLQLYPQGRYQNSVSNLYRRLAWLNNDQAGLARAYGQAIEQGATNSTLLNEMDHKLTAAKAADLANSLPDWIVVTYLAALREHNPDYVSSDDQSPPPDPKVIRQEIDQLSWQKKPLWLSYLPSLQAYYLDHDYQKALTASVVPADAPRTWLNFSQDVIHGLALSALERWPEAEQHWQQLLSVESDPARQTLTQLALAMTLERSGHLTTVYANNSPITTPLFRQTLLRVADANLLRQVINSDYLTIEERKEAVQQLLGKDLSHQAYADFNPDLSLASSLGANLFNNANNENNGYVCPTLAETATRLQNNAQDTQALNCVGDFLRRNGTYLFANIRSDVLGGTKDNFAGKNLNSLDFYQQAISTTKASDNDRAYALHRAMTCFAWSGNNNCGTQEILPNTRKTWFNILKTRFGKTTWAEKQKVYW